MKTTVMLFVLISLFLLQNPAVAGGGKLLRSCEILMNWTTQKHSSEDQYDAGFCLGFISGVYELNAAYLKTGKVERPYFCPPEKGVTNGQNVSILINYLEDNPEKLQDGNLELTLAAFMEAYPCQG